ncbi:MAG: A/G-specific adenine glycosylase [Rhodoferax sp.]
MSPPSEGFAARLVRWQRSHGRNDLPWQQGRDPYRVWLSEIMLQQTQVATVRAYFERFVQALPTVQALAQASAEQVMGLWSGLGYYSRARNLHACAQRIVAEFGGVFPPQASVLATLPGIGRSTASAITSVCFGERVPILDANARRVVARVHAYGQDLARPAHERALWELAEHLLPAPGPGAAALMPAYTQAMMDLGALLCTPRQPGCAQCPVQGLCQAAHQGQAESYPVRSRKLVRRSEDWHLLLLHTPDGAVWLQRRPARGIWAGLLCPPLWPSADALEQAVRSALGAGAALRHAPMVKHVLTHRDLHLHPVWAVVERGALDPAHASAGADLAQVPGAWFGADQWPQQGLPAPVRRLLQGLPPSA